MTSYTEREVRYSPLLR